VVERKEMSLMEELEPQELEDLVHELKEEDGAEEMLSPEVEQLLHILESGGAALERRDAAEQLGKVETSSPRIVLALIAAYESDSYSMVSQAAAESISAPVHQAILQQYPDLMEATERACQQRRVSDRPRDARLRRRKVDAEPSRRRKPVGNSHIGLMISAGVVLVGIGIAGVRLGLRDAGWAMLVGPCFLLCILPGAALLGWAFWNWLAPWGARSVFRRSMKEASAEVSRAWRKEGVDGDGGTTYKYFVTVSLRADDVQGVAAISCSSYG
jgi:hypothetical protein